MYDAPFSQYLAENGITLANPYIDGESVLPSNHAEIKFRLAQRRLSLSQPASSNTDDYERFLQLNESAQNARSVIKNALPLMIGHSDIPHSGGFAFKNLKPLTDDNSLKPAFPESYDGCLPKELNRSVREQLGEYIVPTSNVMVPYLPTFFTECAGPAGAVRVGERHILYTGALGARAVHHLRAFITDPTTALDNNAYVLTALYHSPTGMLWIYAIRAIASPSPSESFAHPKKLEYRMTLISRFNLTLSPESFRDGVRAYRNARDWAKEQRDELVRAANAKV